MIPVVFNAQGSGFLPLPRGVAVQPATLLDRDGNLADPSLGRTAEYLSLVTDSSGAAATIPVCRGAYIYDADGPYNRGHRLYLGPSGTHYEIGGPTAQLVGAGISTTYASISLTPVAGFPLAPVAMILTETDQSDLADLLETVRANPGDLTALMEMLEILGETRAQPTTR